MQLNGPVLKDPIDFRAFYCAGSVAAKHLNPYLAEPLRACEAAVIRQLGFVPLPFLTVPAPLPGYALAAFSLFSHQSFLAANLTYNLMLVVALAAAVVLLRELTGVWLPGILAAIIVSGGWVSVEDGQLAPVILFFLCGSAVALKRRKTVAASTFAAAAMLEPHIALPVVICLAVVVPKTRIPLIASAACLAVVSIACVGWTANVQYIVRVLPEHALAESAAIGQFSLTALLTHFGMHQSAAVIIGNVSYVATALLGCLSALKLYVTSRAREFLVATPVAFVLLGGSFIHITQMVFAIPALFLLWRYFAERRTLLAVAAVLIAIPWNELLEQSADLSCIVSGVISATLAGSLLTRKREMVALIFVSIVVTRIEAAIRSAFPPFHGDPVAAMVAVSGSGASAEATWSVYEHITQSSMTPWYIASHLPTWCGLAIIVAVALVSGTSSISPRKTCNRRLTVA